MPKDYSVEDYSHSIEDHARYTGPVAFGIPNERKDVGGDEGGVPPESPQEDRT